MGSRFTKTDAGREEIRNRARKLSRTARNLLLILDESRPAENWLQLVHGASAEDLRQLQEAGLVQEHVGVPPAQRNSASAGMSVHEAVAHLSYDQLYTLLTSQARERLGLFAGYKFVLDVEKCANIEQLRALAERFLTLVKQHQGEAAERQMRMALVAAA
jgi:hypothetical protein